MNYLVLFIYFLTVIKHSIVIGDDEIPGIPFAHHPHSNEFETLNTGQTSYKINQQDGTHMLISGSEKIIRSDGKEKMEIFCYQGETPNVANLLKTVELRVSIQNENFYYYQGSNASTIKKIRKESYWFSLSPWKPTTFRMDLYNLSCVGIETKEPFSVALVVRHVDLWRLVALAVGLALFFAAPLLAHNVIFHYATGVSVGIFGSLLVIIFILSRSIPKKTGALTVLIGGWGLVLYFVQYIWLNCLSMVKEYYPLIVGYVFVVGLISFALVYRYGPLTDNRSISLVQWSLQLLALLSIFFSCQCREVTLALILLILVNYNIPSSWKSFARSYWLRHFPPKPHLLTEEEFLEQSRIETKKALDELREFCHSPNCNAWKTMSRLRTPQRFAEFVEGSSHLADDEILAYENISPIGSDDGTDPYLTSDEEDLVEENGYR